MNSFIKLLLIMCFVIPELALNAGGPVEPKQPAQKSEKLYSIDHQKRSGRRSSSRRRRHGRSRGKAKGSNWIRNWGKDMGWGRIRF